MTEVSLPLDHPIFKNRHRSMLAANREILQRQNKALFLGTMMTTDVLLWLEGRDWDLAVGLFQHRFLFSDPRDAMMFKLTWGGQ